METHLREGVVKEKFPNSRKASHWQISGEFWNLRGQHNQEKQTNREYTPKHNSNQRSSPDACVHHHQAGTEQGGELDA